MNFIQLCANTRGKVFPSRPLRWSLPLLLGGVPLKPPLCWTLFCRLGWSLSFRTFTVIPNETCHSELVSESMEGECKTYTDAESSSAWRWWHRPWNKFRVTVWRFAVCGSCGHSELDSESVKAYNIDLWVKKGMSTLWQIPLILSCTLV